MTKVTLITFPKWPWCFFPLQQYRRRPAQRTMELILLWNFVPLVTEKNSVYVVLLIITLIVCKAEHFVMFLSNLSFDELLIHVFFQSHHWGVCPFLLISKSTLYIKDINHCLSGMWRFSRLLVMLLWLLTLLMTFLMHTF